MSLQAIARKLADTNELGSLEDKTRFGTSAKSLDSRIHKREEKELRRVFDFLTLFKERHKIEAALEQRQQALKQKKAFLGACVDKRHLQGSLVTLTPELLADEMKELAKDISEFEKMLKRLKERPNRKIGKADLSEAIRVKPFFMLLIAFCIPSSVLFGKREHITSSPSPFLAGHAGKSLFKERG